MSDVLRSRTVRRFGIAIALVAALCCGLLVGRARADQPHMQSALQHLQAAKGELELATADKGGHRTKALSLVNDAIVQVQQGIEYARTH
jgi:hypothetical protein